MNPNPSKADRPITSPSNLYRRRMCPGSARMEMQVPRENETNEWSEEGTLLHLHTAQPDLDRSGLTPGQLEILQLGEALELEALDQIALNASIGPDDTFTQHREKRLVFRDGNTFVFPGTCDLLRIYKRDVLAINDLKYGYQEVTSADNNLQMAAYSAMAEDDYPSEMVYCAITQPRGEYGRRITMAAYTRGQLVKVREQILEIVELTKADDAPLNPSPIACRNCRAKEICTAYRDTFSIVVQTGVDSMLALPDEQFAQIGDAIKLAAMLGKEWNDEARRRIEAGELKGWHLKNTGSTSSLNDIRVAYGRFAGKYQDRFDSPGDCSIAFMACLEPRWGRLDNLFAQLEKVGEKKARKSMEDLFRGLIEKEEKSKSPVRDA